MHHALSLSIIRCRGDVVTRFILLLSADAYAMQLCKQGLAYAVGRGAHGLFLKLFDDTAPSLLGESQVSIANKRLLASRCRPGGIATTDLWGHYKQAITWLGRLSRTAYSHSRIVLAFVASLGIAFFQLNIFLRN
jgi:hypothetical protein